MEIINMICNLLSMLVAIGIFILALYWRKQYIEKNKIDVQRKIKGLFFGSIKYLEIKMTKYKGDIADRKYSSTEYLIKKSKKIRDDLRYLIRTDGFAFLDENLCKKLDDLTDDIEEESKKIKDENIDILDVIINETSKDFGKGDIYQEINDNLNRIREKVKEFLK